MEMNNEGNSVTARMGIRPVQQDTSIMHYALKKAPEGAFLLLGKAPDLSCVVFYGSVSGEDACAGDVCKAHLVPL